MADNSPNIFCVRGYDSEHGGPQAQKFIKGGYIAIGWFDSLDLSDVRDRTQLQQLYPRYHPEDKSPNVIGQQVGQIARFLFEIKPGDIILTPDYNPDGIYWGLVQQGIVSYEPNSTDGCPFPHRRSVEWNNTPLQRSGFSAQMRYSLGSSLTVFNVSHHKAEFFRVIERPDLISQAESEAHRVQKGYNETIIERLMSLHHREFEILVTELLEKLGFEAQHVGKPGDESVDVEGVLRIFNIAKVKLYVQVKRYQPGNNITSKIVKALRMKVRQGEQGAVITTSDFQDEALVAAEEPGFARIGTMNGDDLVKLLSEKWEELEQTENEEIKGILEKLALQRGLVFKE